MNEASWLRGERKKKGVGRPARGGGARTHIVGLAGVRHRGVARARARRLAEEVDVRSRACFSGSEERTAQNKRQQ